MADLQNILKTRSAAPKIARHLSAVIARDLQDIDAVFINGARQTGKSTFVETFGRRYSPVLYASLDDISLRSAEINSPGQTFARVTGGLIILDEVQRIPQSFLAIKAKIDEARRQRQSIKFLLTGSADIALFPQLAAALVGRMYVRTMQPFSAAELLRKPGSFLERLFSADFPPLKTLPRHSAAEMISRATFPGLSLNVENKTAWCQNYISTLLERDVKNLAEVNKPAELTALLNLLANRVGGLLNDTSLASAAKLTLSTCRRYRALFENVFLTALLPPWHKTLAKRFVKAPKIYFTDTLLLCHLLGLRPQEAAQKRPDIYGFILENFVFTELKKLLSLSDEYTLYHFRTQDQKEIDFLLEKRDGSLAAVEVKAALTVAPADFKHLRLLQNTKNFACGVILYQGRQILQIDHNLFALPLASLWGLD
ncbi:MAG: ATP-binding protein [Candidatus Margulisbacteria bacterium]|jgi:predicted AAA+ superfamily ATPase|nr:ATP-binding protein [Candidatus Margulisiibacteriota bacterium]